MRLARVHGNHLLGWGIWEAFYHRLGVPVLRMFLETEVVQARALDRSRLVNGDITTHAGALVVTSCEKVI